MLAILSRILLTGNMKWRWKNGQYFRIDATFRSPVSLAPGTVKLFGFVRITKLVQLMRKGLIGIHVILVPIVATPIEFEPTERFQIIGVARYEPFEKEAVMQAFGDS